MTSVDQKTAHKPTAKIAPGKRVVWLAAYPKSGNTWLRIFLENLLQNQDEPLDINQPRQFTGMGDMTPFLYENQISEPLEELSDAEHVALRFEAHQRLSALGQTVVFAKTHTANISKFGRPLFYPQSTRAAIYVVRNPLDIVDSLTDHWGLTHDQTIEHMINPDQYAMNPIGSSANNASAMKAYLGSWSSNVESWTQTKTFPVLVLRYEDMLEDPVKQFTRVVRFLAAPFTARQIERAVRFSSFKAIKAQEEKHGFAELSDNSKDGAFFRHGKAGRWDQVLNRSQIKRVRRLNADMMKAFGYEA